MSQKDSKTQNKKTYLQVLETGKQEAGPAQSKPEQPGPAPKTRSCSGCGLGSYKSDEERRSHEYECPAVDLFPRRELDSRIQQAFWLLETVEELVREEVRNPKLSQEAARDAVRRCIDLANSLVRMHELE